MSLYGYERLRVYYGYETIGESNDRFVGNMEVSYKEYDLDGHVVTEGTEDFSRQRYYSELCAVWVWTWNEGSYNRGGYKAWKCRLDIKIRKSDRALAKLFEAHIYGADDVQLRKAYL